MDFVEQAKHFVECGTVVVDVGVQQTAGHVVVERVEVLRQIAAGFKVKAGAQAVEDDVDGLGDRSPLLRDVARVDASAGDDNRLPGAFEKQDDELMGAGPLDARF